MTTKKRFYYDVNITNNIFTNPSGALFPAIFEETREQPLFSDAPSKYTLSVVRFSFPTGNIPIQIVPVVYDSVNPSNPNNTIYSISMKYNNIIYTQNIQWVSQDQSVATPTPPTLIPSNTYKTNDYYAYYALWSLSHLTDLINNTINDCFQLNIVPLLPPPAPGTSYISPYMSYDGSTGLMTLRVPELFIFSFPAGYTVQLGGNYLFQSLILRSWSTTQLGRNLPTKLDFFYNLINTNQNQLPDPSDNGGFIYSFQQDFDTSGNISKFQALVITSTTLPVVYSQISNQATSLAVSSIAGGFLPVITDFEIDGSTLSNLQVSIQYYPTAEFRRITMLGNSPITQINLNIYTRDVFGNLSPLYLPDNTTGTIKILFEEK